jgi:hypothetical protein
MHRQENVGKIPKPTKLLLVAKLAIYFEKQIEALREKLESGNVDFKSLMVEVVLKQRMLAAGVRRSEAVRILGHLYGEEYAEKKFDKIKERLGESGVLVVKIEKAVGRKKTKGRGRPPRTYYLSRRFNDGLGRFEWLRSLVKYAFLASSYPYALTMIAEALLKWLKTLNEKERLRILRFVALETGSDEDEVTKILREISTGALEEGYLEEIKRILEKAKGKLDQESYEFLRDLFFWKPVEV